LFSFLPRFTIKQTLSLIGALEFVLLLTYNLFKKEL